MLNRASPLPLYRQLASRLAEDIQQGRYAIGERLPSEPELSRQFQIGRPTVRQATDTLIQRHLIERRRGAGTFVLARPPEVDVFSTFGTVAAFKAQGLELSVKLVEPLKLRTFKGDTEHPLQGQRVYQFSRVGRFSREPVLLERFFLSAEVFVGLEAIDLSQASLAEVLREQLFLMPTGGRQSFRVHTLAKPWAVHLGVSEQEPLLLIERSLDFKQARGALFSQLFCRSDQVLFSQTIQTNPQSTHSTQA